MRKRYKKLIHFLLFIFTCLSMNACGYTERIHTLSELGRIKDIQEYLDKGGDINQETKRNWLSGSSSSLTPLHFAIIGGQTETVKFLLDKGANIEARSAKGHPLYLATNLAEAEIMRLLLEKNASVKAATGDGAPLLHLAIWSTGLNSKDIKRTRDNQRRTNAARVLLEFGLQADVRDRHGATPLMRAGRFDNQLAIELLQQHGADINAIDGRGGNILFYVGKRQSGRTEQQQLQTLKIFERLLQRGVDITHMNQKNRSLLYTNCNPHIIRILLAEKLDVNHQDNEGNTPLHLVMKCELTALRTLITAGANPNAKNKKGLTPLHIALLSRKINEKKMSYLLDHLDDPNVRDINGVSLLHAITQQGKSTWAFEKLIQRGANINSKDNSGCTPLHWAVHHRHSRFVKALLDAGANPNLQDMQGRTALHIVAGNNNLSTLHVKPLLKAGARRDIKDNIGFYPFQLAQKAHKNEGVVKQLLVAELSDSPMPTEPVLRDLCVPRLFTYQLFML